MTRCISTEPRQLHNDEMYKYRAKSNGYNQKNRLNSKSTSINIKKDK